VPHLAFYAALDDAALIMEFVFRECRVFEGYSTPDSPIRDFANPLELRTALAERGPGGLDLMLYSPSMKGEFVVERFELKPGAIPGKSWRERISGWGLIQLELIGVREGKLRPSFTNHNTASRARAWSVTYPEVPTVEAWDFEEVTRISRRINRHIAGLGVRTVGSRPILPAADAMANAGDIVLGAA
jgi:hypothetical protein